MTPQAPQLAIPTPVSHRTAAMSKPALGPIVDPALRVRKRDGTQEAVDPLQILLKVARCADGLPNIDPQVVADKAIRGIYDGVGTVELDNLLIANAAMLIAEEPEYS